MKYILEILKAFAASKPSCYIAKNSKAELHKSIIHVHDVPYDGCERSVSETQC